MEDHENPLAATTVKWVTQPNSTTRMPFFSVSLGRVCRNAVARSLAWLWCGTKPRMAWPEASHVLAMTQIPHYLPLPLRCHFSWVLQVLQVGCQLPLPARSACTVKDVPWACIPNSLNVAASFLSIHASFAKSTAVRAMPLRSHVLFGSGGHLLTLTWVSDSDFQIFRFSISGFYFFKTYFRKHMLVRYRGINNKGVLERPGTKWKVLRTISNTLKFQECQKSWKFIIPLFGETENWRPGAHFDVKYVSAPFCHAKTAWIAIWSKIFVLAENPFFFCFFPYWSPIDLLVVRKIWFIASYSLLCLNQFHAGTTLTLLAEMPSRGALLLKT